MTLDASGLAVLAAPATARDVSSRAPGASNEDAGLVALAALLAEASAVSSDEAGSGGFTAASLRSEETSRVGGSPVEALLHGPVSPEPLNSPASAARAEGGRARVPADAMPAESREAADAFIAPPASDTRDPLGAMTVHEEAGAPAETHALPAASAREAEVAHDAADGSASAVASVTGRAGTEGTGVLAPSGSAALETAADATGNGVRNELSKAPDDREDPAATATASSLDEALLRDIAETPAVFSDSIGIDAPSGSAERWNSGAEAALRDVGPANGVDEPPGGVSAFLIHATPSASNSTGTAGAPQVPREDWPARVEAPGSEDDAVIDDESFGGPLVARPVGSIAGADDGTSDVDVGPVISPSDPSVLPASDGDAGREEESPWQISAALAASCGQITGANPGLSDTGEASVPDAWGAGEDDEVHETRGEDDSGELGVPSFLHGDRGAPARARAAGPVPIDVLLGDIAEAPSVSSDETGSPDSAAGVAPRDGDTDVDARTAVDPDPALHSAGSTDVDAPGGLDEATETARGAEDAMDPSEGAAADRKHSEDSTSPVRTALAGPTLRQTLLSSTALPASMPEAPSRTSHSTPQGRRIPIPGGGTDESADSVARAADVAEETEAVGARSEGTADPARIGPEVMGWETDRNCEPVSGERLTGHSDAHGEASRPSRPAAGQVEAIKDRTDPDEPAVAALAEDAIDADSSGDAGTEEGAGSVIHLPDLSGEPVSEAGAGHNEALLRQIADVVAESAGRHGEAAGPLHADALETDDDTPTHVAHDPHAPEHVEELPGGGDREDASDIALSDSGGMEDVGGLTGIEDGGKPRAFSSSHEVSGAPVRAHASGPVPVDVLLRDIAEAPSVSSDEAGMPDFAAGIASRDDDSDVDVGTTADQARALRFAGSAAPQVPDSKGEAHGPGDETRPSEWAEPGDARSEEIADPIRTGPAHADEKAGRTDAGRPDARSGAPGNASSAPEEPLAPWPGSPADPTGSRAAAVAASTEYAFGADDAAEAGTEEGAGSVIHLPDLSGLAGSAPDGTGDTSILRQIADAVAESAGEAVGEADDSPVSVSSVSGDWRAGGPAVSPGHADGTAPDDTLPDDEGVVVFPVPGKAVAPGRPAGAGGRSDSGRQPSEPADEAGTAAAEAGIVFDDTLVLDLVDAVPVSSDVAASPEPAFDISLPDREAASSDEAGDADVAGFADMALEAAPPGPAAALAFATDPDTETALRDGLLGFDGASAGTGEPQVWQGGLRAAVAALGEGRSSPLVIVDIDGLPYPAGAIHELAAVCEVGTVVVAVGSDDSARPGRELLLAGVSDYLAKPLTAEAVRRVASHALADAGSRPGGLVACFAGCGGSGATTLATATALQAAARGCYVSVLDLSRSVPAAALGLGVDPVAGLDQLLETADGAAVEAEALEGVCARRSDRIEVYAHRWSPEHPAPASVDAVDRLLAVLRQRSQMVIVDGLDEAAMRFLPSLETDMRVFVAEPTAGRTAHLGRMLALLPSDRPLVLVQNHTRSFGRNGRAGSLREAAAGIDPDLVVPFDPAVPETADWGWPQGRLPRSLRKPVASLADRLLGASSGAGAASLGAARAA